jgi:hypothetical protein
MTPPHDPTAGRDGSRVRVFLLPAVLLAVLAVAMLVTQWLPFVNGPHVWFGLPSMFVWAMVTSTLITPALALLERAHRRDRRERAGREPQQDGFQEGFQEGGAR